MFCVYCGAKLNNEFIFCWKCGKKRPEILSDDEKSAVPEPESKTVSEELPEADVNEYSFEDNEEETVFEDDEEETVFEDDEEEAVFEDNEEETVFEDDENITKEKINTSNGTDNISSNMSFYYERTPEGNVITSITGENGEYSFTNIPKGIYIVVFEF